MLNTKHQLEQIEITGLEWQNSKCPFCGKERTLSSRAGALPQFTTYDICKCEEAQENYRIMRERTFQKNDLEMKYELLEQKLQAEKEKATKLLKESNLGRRFSNRTFEAFNIDEDNKTAYNLCRKYAAGFNENEDGNGIILTGPVGTGKTHLAAAVVNEIIKTHHIPVKFTTAIDMFTALKDFTDETMSQYKEASLLVIDDLGKEKVTEWNREKLYEIINARYENYRPVFITTNLSPQELDTELGKATVSRLIEMCIGCTVLGKDHRI